MRVALFYVLFLSQSFSALAQNITNEQRIVAITILAESRGEKIDGMGAICAIIRQRAIERKQTSKQVCLAKWQFSCWNGKSLKDLEYLLDLPQAKTAIYFAKNINSINRAKIGFANHYHATWMKKKPYWAKGKAPIKIIGQHAFYKLDKSVH